MLTRPVADGFLLFLVNFGTGLGNVYTPSYLKPWGRVMNQPVAPTGTRGVGYVRVSRDSQETDRQHAAIRSWAERHGVTVAQVFEDRGSRDQAYKRPDFIRLLKAVESGLVDWVVVD